MNETLTQHKSDPYFVCLLWLICNLCKRNPRKWEPWRHHWQLDHPWRCLFQKLHSFIFLLDNNETAKDLTLRKWATNFRAKTIPHMQPHPDRGEADTCKHTETHTYNSTMHSANQQLWYGESDDPITRSPTISLIPCYTFTRDKKFKLSRNGPPNVQQANNSTSMSLYPHEK